MFFCCAITNCQTTKQQGSSLEPRMRTLTEKHKTENSSSTHVQILCSSTESPCIYRSFISKSALLPRPATLPSPARRRVCCSSFLAPSFSGDSCVPPEPVSAPEAPLLRLEIRLNVKCFQHSRKWWNRRDSHTRTRPEDALHVLRCQR